MMWWCHLALSVLLWTVSSVHCFPDGPPESACIDMQPGVRIGVVGLIGHLASPQNVVPTYGNKKTPPYYINVHQPDMIYEPGQEIQVSIVANQTAGLVMYRGILLQARKVICASDLGHENQTIMVEDDTISSFRTIHGDMLLKTMKCGETEQSAVCHKSPQYKINETVMWVAPNENIGHVIFRATIVQEENIYWTNVYSGMLHGSDMDPEPAKCTACCTNACTNLLALLLLFTLLYIRLL